MQIMQAYRSIQTLGIFLATSVFVSDIPPSLVPIISVKFRRFISCQCDSTCNVSNVSTAN